jgi:hypothetical protein
MKQKQDFLADQFSSILVYMYKIKWEMFAEHINLGFRPDILLGFVYWGAAESHRAGCKGGDSVKSSTLVK